MYRAITCNTNGIRAANRKGFFEWLATQDADVVCIQETKAQEHQLVDDVFRPEGYHCYYNDAERKGYSGTALFAKQKPQSIEVKVGWEPVDSEGRYLRADFEGLSVISLYVPSGSSNEAAQARKDVFMERFTPHLKSLLSEDREFIICADWNTCHQNIDLKNWRNNQKNSGFMPYEREWLTHLYEEQGWVDAFREFTSEPEQYTWWSNRGQAWVNNTGWRLDYMLVSPGLSGRAREVAVYKETRFSDHAPVIIDFEI